MKSHVFHHDVRRVPPLAVSGSRCWVFDSDHQRWLDGTSGAGAVTVGYGVGEISSAIQAQAAELPFVYARHFTSRPKEELARMVVSIAPPGMDRVFFTSGGSEANESAVKIARLFHLERGEATRHKVISRNPGYHGNTLSMLSVTGRPSWTEPYRPMLAESPKVPAPYPRLKETKDIPPNELEAACARALEDAILAAGPDTVAAFITEPIVGATLPAFRSGSQYWASVREICDRYGVLLIIDEVFTGYGRTGKAFAVDHWDLAPDLITCGKGISGGYAPLGAVIARGRVVEAFEEGSGKLQHSFTFSGHPLACAAGVAALTYVEREHLVDRSARLGTKLLEMAKGLQRHDAVGEVRGLGLHVGIELDGATRDGRRYADAVAMLAASQRVLIGVSPSFNHLQLMPPFTTDENELALMIETIDGALDRIGSGPVE